MNPPYTVSFWMPTTSRSGDLTVTDFKGHYRTFNFGDPIVWYELSPDTRATLLRTFFRSLRDEGVVFLDPHHEAMFAERILAS